VIVTGTGGKPISGPLTCPLITRVGGGGDGVGVTNEVVTTALVDVGTSEVVGLGVGVGLLAVVVIPNTVQEET